MTGNLQRCIVIFHRNVNMNDERRMLEFFAARKCKCNSQQIDFIQRATVFPQRKYYNLLLEVGLSQKKGILSHVTATIWPRRHATNKALVLLKSLSPPSFAFFIPYRQILFAQETFECTFYYRVLVWMMISKINHLKSRENGYICAEGNYLQINQMEKNQVHWICMFHSLFCFDLLQHSSF